MSNSHVEMQHQNPDESYVETCVCVCVKGGGGEHCSIAFSLQQQT